MPITFEQVFTALNALEPDYPGLALTLGQDALPHLARLIKGGNAMLAAKAAYLAGLLPAQQAMPTLKMAACSADPKVRVAVAATAKNLPPDAASELLLQLIDDPYFGVRKFALKSLPIPTRRSRDLREKLETLRPR